MRKLLVPAMFVWKTKAAKHKIQKHERGQGNMVMLRVQTSQNSELMINCFTWWDQSLVTSTTYFDCVLQNYLIADSETAKDSGIMDNASRSEAS